MGISIRHFLARPTTTYQFPSTVTGERRNIIICGGGGGRAHLVRDGLRISSSKRRRRGTTHLVGGSSSRHEQRHRPPRRSSRVRQRGGARDPGVRPPISSSRPAASRSPAVRGGRRRNPRAVVTGPGPCPRSNPLKAGGGGAETANGMPKAVKLNVEPGDDYNSESNSNSNFDEVIAKKLKVMMEFESLPLPSRSSTAAKGIRGAQPDFHSYYSFVLPLASTSTTKQPAISQEIIISIRNFIYSVHEFELGRLALALTILRNQSYSLSARSREIRRGSPSAIQFGLLSWRRRCPSRELRWRRHFKLRRCAAEDLTGDVCPGATPFPWWPPFQSSVQHLPRGCGKEGQFEASCAGNSKQDAWMEGARKFTEGLSSGMGEGGRSFRHRGRGKFSGSTSKGDGFNTGNMKSKTIIEEAEARNVVKTATEENVVIEGEVNTEKIAGKDDTVKTAGEGSSLGVIGEHVDILVDVGWDLLSPNKFELLASVEEEGEDLGDLADSAKEEEDEDSVDEESLGDLVSNACDVGKIPSGRKHRSGKISKTAASGGQGTQRLRIRWPPRRRGCLRIAPRRRCKRIRSGKLLVACSRSSRRR